MAGEASRAVRAGKRFGGPGSPRQVREFEKQVGAFERVEAKAWGGKEPATPGAQAATLFDRVTGEASVSRESPSSEGRGRDAMEVKSRIRVLDRAVREKAAIQIMLGDLRLGGAAEHYQAVIDDAAGGKTVGDDTLARAYVGRARLAPEEALSDLRRARRLNACDDTVAEIELGLGIHEKDSEARAGHLHAGLTVAPFADQRSRLHLELGLQRRDNPLWHFERAEAEGQRPSVRKSARLGKALAAAERERARESLNPMLEPEAAARKPLWLRAAIGGGAGLPDRKELIDGLRKTVASERSDRRKVDSWLLLAQLKEGDVSELCASVLRHATNRDQEAGACLLLAKRKNLTEAQRLDYLNRAETAAEDGDLRAAILVRRGGLSHVGATDDLRQVIGQPANSIAPAPLLAEAHAELAKLRNGDAAWHLMHAYGNAEDPVLRTRCLIGLGDAADPRDARRYYDKALREAPTEELRARAAFGKGRLGGNGARETLEHALRLATVLGDRDLMAKIRLAIAAEPAPPAIPPSPDAVSAKPRAFERRIERLDVGANLEVAMHVAEDENIRHQALLGVADWMVRNPDHAGDVAARLGEPGTIYKQVAEGSENKDIEAKALLGEAALRRGKDAKKAYQKAIETARDDRIREFAGQKLAALAEEKPMRPRKGSIGDLLRLFDKNDAD